jgi:hypothetical protein
LVGIARKEYGDRYLLSYPQARQEKEGDQRSCPEEEISKGNKRKIWEGSTIAKSIERSDINKQEKKEGFKVKQQKPNINGS